jgi:hypothetical protein
VPNKVETDSPCVDLIGLMPDDEQRPSVEYFENFGTTQTNYPSVILIGRPSGGEMSHSRTEIKMVFGGLNGSLTGIQQS